MICDDRTKAADRQAPRDQHCDDPGCTCGHRVERYGTTTRDEAGRTTPAPTIGCQAPSA